jgi:hypothetical protein
MEVSCERHLSTRRGEIGSAQPVHPEFLDQYARARAKPVPLRTVTRPPDAMPHCASILMSPALHVGPLLRRLERQASMTITDALPLNSAATGGAT